MLRVVLAHLLVRRCRKADDGVWAGMAHVDADKHSPLFLDSLRKFKCEEVSSNLAVNLS